MRPINPVDEQRSSIEKYLPLVNRQLSTIMSCILNIETSTSVCSVALSADGEVLFEKSSFEGPSHAALLGVYAEEAIAVTKEKGLKLDAVAVSSGPGSYTGLRIGVSVAKGLCFGYGIPLISIPTLEVLAVAALEQQNNASDCLYCAMLDARRMEVYAAIYDVSLNGAAKCREVITSPNALFIDNIRPLAVNMVTLSEKAFAESRFEDVAYFEPFYLKEFQATIAKNKVLG